MAIVTMFSCATMAAAQTTPSAAHVDPHDGWPQILRGAGHSSLSPDRALRASTGRTLGLNWMSPMRSADLGGPVAAYNPALQTTVAYVGDERGDVIAYNEVNGTSIWSTSVGFGDSERSTPAVAPDGSVWAATAYNPTIYKLDGTTGNVLCSLKLTEKIDSSIMFATPPGGVPTIYTASISVGNAYGLAIAVRQSDCKLIWSYDKWGRQPSGAWATPAYGIDATGKGRIYIGTSTPDDAMYALDALTGTLVWTYSAYVPGDYDIGAAATVSPPGNNGFNDGVLYFRTKFGIMYALDLTTGKIVWQYYFDGPAKLRDGGITSAALYKTMLVYGMGNGAEAVDARTGKLIWHFISPTRQEVFASPAIAGPPGDEIVAFGDAAGTFYTLRLADGKLLYRYQTGNYITGSPAIVNGHILQTSTDGFLYDFTTGGGNAPPPTTAISYPATGSKIANPAGTLSVSGSATDATGLTEVFVSVQSGGPTGPWYDGAANSWVPGPYNNLTGVHNYLGKQSTWAFSFPVPSSGSNYVVTANAVNIQGSVDRKGAQTAFSVEPNPNAPQLSLAAPLEPPTGTDRATATGFAAHETVDFALQGKVLAHATTSQGGSVADVALHVPATDSFGPSSVTATGETSHLSTTAPLDVTNVWTQAGYDAGRGGYEAHDSVLESTVVATNGGYLSRAWLYMTGAPVTTPPAVVNGSAYLGNANGTMTSVDTASGAAFWSYTLPSNAAIRGAPAVGNGDVVFGADDGTIDRLDAASGTLLGSVAVAGKPASPALSSGSIYVGTDGGTVYAIDEATGTQRWATVVGAPVRYGVAVDPHAAVVVVGDDAGHVTTLDAATGKMLRQASTGGAAVTAGPIVSSGAVIVGASDGTVRAYDEKSASPKWKYTPGSAVHALASTGQELYVGDDAGTLVELHERDGSVVGSIKRIGTAVAGIGLTTGVAVVATSDGAIVALKDGYKLRPKYHYKTGGSLATQPVLLDGSVFVGGGDGGLYAFTNHGQAPEDSRERRSRSRHGQPAPALQRWPSSRLP